MFGLIFDIGMAKEGLGSGLELQWGRAQFALLIDALRVRCTRLFVGDTPHNDGCWLTCHKRDHDITALFGVGLERIATKCLRHILNA